jgi:hypothetical protein
MNAHFKSYVSKVEVCGALPGLVYFVLRDCL